MKTRTKWILTVLLFLVGVGVGVNAELHRRALRALAECEAVGPVVLWRDCVKVVDLARLSNARRDPADAAEPPRPGPEWSCEQWGAPYAPAPPRVGDPFKCPPDSINEYSGLSLNERGDVLVTPCTKY